MGALLLAALAVVALAKRGPTQPRRVPISSLGFKPTVAANGSTGGTTTNSGSSGWDLLGAGWDYLKTNYDVDVSFGGQDNAGGAGGVASGSANGAIGGAGGQRPGYY